MSRRLSEADWAAMRFEAGELFTPSTPIGVAELFAGRQKEIIELLDAVSERGAHAVVYGEPGVGKTSLAQILRHFVPRKTSSVRYIRKPAFSSDTYSSIWIDIFKEIPFVVEVDDGERQYSVADMYSAGVAPNDVVRELSYFSDNDIPIIVIDEYNLVRDPDVSRLMAETIKAVSDASLKTTIVIIGISDNVASLMSGHSSILRNTREILMPRMNGDEMQELLSKRIQKLGMRIVGDAKWKIINLCKGLPSFAHNLGKGAVLSAIVQRSLEIKEFDVDKAIEDVLTGSQNTLKTDYEHATHSNQQKARYRQILTACALARSDESGYFTPKQVQEPLRAILNRPIGIDGFNQNLKDLASTRRGNVLQTKGGERLYRYRFRNPAMQPFVIMKGIKDGFLDEEAKRALSAHAQPDLFASGD
jgi:Cdc6-like AAA superfamily ATPase